MMILIEQVMLVNQNVLFRPFKKITSALQYLVIYNSKLFQRNHIIIHELQNYIKGTSSQ